MQNLQQIHITSHTYTDTYPQKQKWSKVQRRKKLMASGAAKMVLGCVFNGSLSLHELNIERRPYHKNCSCALHDLKGVCSSNTCSKKNTLSFQKKQVWGSTENHSLSLSASKTSSHLLLNECSSRDVGNSLLKSWSTLYILIRINWVSNVNYHELN